MNVDIAALRLRAAATNNLRVANLDMPEQIIIIMELVFRPCL
jgi:hypothetical protein